MDIPKMMLMHFPECEYTCNGDDYEGLTVTNGEKPPLETLQAKWEEYQADYEATAYQRARQKEYPPINDLVVALWEMVVEGRPEAAEGLQALREAVKSRNARE